MAEALHGKDKSRQGLGHLIWRPSSIFRSLLRHGLGDLRNQLFDETVPKRVGVFRGHDERARAADDVVAVVVCKPTRRVRVVGFPKGWRLGQDNEPVDRDVFSDSLVPCRSDIAAAIVIAISRNVDGTAARLVGCPVELGHREVDPGADRRAVGKCARRLDDVIAEQTRAVLSSLITIQSITIFCDKGPDHSTNVTAMRRFGPLRMASITRESEKAAAYPER